MSKREISLIKHSGKRAKKKDNEEFGCESDRIRYFSITDPKLGNSAIDKKALVLSAVIPSQKCNLRARELEAAVVRLWLMVIPGFRLELYLWFGSNRKRETFECSNVSK